MKKLVYLFGLSFALILAACSGTDNNMPVSPQLEKGIADVQSFPYKLYQTFPQLIGANVTWHNEKEGIIVLVDDRSEPATNRFLFATVEYANNKGYTMAFLGNSKTGSYFLNGFNAKEIASISIFYNDVSISVVDNNPPHSPGQIFNSLGIKGWADGGAYAKVSSYSFPANLNYLFARLIASTGNQLIFLGKPRSESFDFPKSEKNYLKDIKLFTYQK